MKFLDFFAGIGGFRLGMEMAGHECGGHCEWDKYANASYIAMHNPKEDEWYGRDIRDVRADELPGADVWCFGFPCQDISVAGKQLGFDGKRSSLFFTVTRLIRDTREEDKPTTLFIENVKNLLSVNGGIDFLKLLIELDEIGYDAEWQVLNSKDFGVPQNRERVFIVGHLRGRGGGEVFPINGTGGEADVKQIGQLFGTENEANPSGGRVFDPEGLMRTLGSGHGMSQPYITTSGVKAVGNVNPSGNGMNGNVFDSEGLAPTLTTNKGEGNKIAIPVLTPDRIEKRQNGRRFKEDGDPMFTLTAQDRHGVAVYQKTFGGTVTKKYDETGTLQSARLDKTPCVESGFRIRKLTPKECFRLQGFPDTYFERAAAVNSNSQLYKQAGNSVTVNVIYEIAKRLGK